jgi:rhamnosyltransferase
MSEISILIRTYNEEAFLPLTLEALFAQSEKSFDIVLVDSGSTDKTLEIARDYDDIRIIELPKKDFTYGRALNIGIAAVVDKVKYIAMLSAHAIPCTDDWLRELLLPVRDDPQVVGVYGKQVPFPEHMHNPMVRALAAEVYPNCYGDMPFITTTSYFFSNVNSLITSENWRHNKFDESLEYCEDWGWARAVITSGGRIAYQPAAAVYHSHAGNFRNYFVRAYCEGKASRKIDPISHPLVRRRECWRTVINLFFVYLRRCLIEQSLRGLHWDICRFRVINTVATYKGRKDARIGS